MRVAILGGGACGTTAALSLAEAGVETLLVEREPRIGGLCGTERHGDFRFDFGGHRFLSTSPRLEALVRDLVGADLLLRSRSSVVLNGGRRYHYPLQLDDVMRNVGPREAARALMSYGRQRLRPPGDDRSFEAWVVRRFGRALYDQFFGPYTQKLWGLHPTQISADWAAERISLPSLADVAWRLFGLGRGEARTYARRYLYPRFGIGQIFEKMADRARAHGAAIALGASVTGLGRTADGRLHAVAYTDASGRSEEWRCDAVLSTISLPLLTRLLGENTLPNDVAAAATRLRFRGIRLLHLLLDRPEVTPHTWLYVSEPRYLIARIQEPRQRSPEMAPAGRSSLMLEIPCDVGDEVWAADEAKLVERCLGELGALGFPSLGRQLLGHFSSYVSEGYPVYHLDYRADRARLLDYVSQAPNLISSGRQGAFRYIFMDTAMELGLAAAERLQGRLGLDPPEPAAAGPIEARALTA